MDQKTARKLVSLNHKFYQTFAEDFSETRQRLQPGVLRVLDSLPGGISILDLGCGNGQLARVLAERSFPCTYLGTDFSARLIAEARQKIPEDYPAAFYPLDLTAEDWSSRLPEGRFDVIFAFAVFHHLPGEHLRRRVCRSIEGRLKTDGDFYLSSWQFLKSDRLQKRIQPWSAAEIDPEQVDEGDYLLDWRRGGFGLRYVHYYTREELTALAETSGFAVRETFYSDGKEGNLSIYQRWQPLSSDH